MGHRASVYLTDEFWDAWKESGLPLGELVRRGLGAGVPLDEAAMRGLLGEWFGLPSHATHGGTSVTEVPQSAGVPDTTVRGTGTTPSGTPKAARASKAAGAELSPNQSERVVASLPDLPGGLTVASALPKPKPKNCKHANMRIRKGPCPDCGEWVSVSR